MKRCLACSLLIFALSCGGGTSGTGIGTTAAINGNVQAQDGQPIAGAVVEVVGSDTHVITDQQGNFTIDANCDDSSITLSINESHQENLISVDPTVLGSASVRTQTVLPQQSVISVAVVSPCAEEQ